MAFEYKVKFQKKASFIWVQNRHFWHIFLKKLYEVSFQYFKSIVIENYKPVPLCPIKWRPFKIFVKSHKSPLLIANTVNSAVSGLRQFLATESPWKLKKNAFYFILKALFILKIFKFLSWLFDHVEKTVWLERKG